MTQERARALDGRAGFVFVECTEVDERMFDRLYQELLEPAFPAEELIGMAEMRAAYQTPLPGFLGTVVLREDEPVAVALGEYSEASGVMLLCYLAVRPDMRGYGLGGALLDEVLPRWRRILKPVATLAEVEDPRLHGSHELRGDPVARMRLYERKGSTLLPLAYFQPSLQPDQPRARGMFLISLDEGATGVPVDALLAFLDEYVEGCEGEETMRTDPEYRALRDQVSSWQDEVPLWPMSRAAEVARSAYETGGARA